MKFLFFLCLSSLFAEPLQHECGIALIQLKKPLSYYEQTYQDPFWGTKKLLCLLEKQRNRGQDGAGISVVRLNQKTPSIHTLRFAQENSLDQIVSECVKTFDQSPSPFLGELMLGHLRYATYSGCDSSCCQPFLCPTHHLALAGNFNMTNIPTLKRQFESDHLLDTRVVLDSLCHFLNQDPSLCYGHLLSKAAPQWDGGYVMCGIGADGRFFVCRDPNGIRPCYYYTDEEVFAVASERFPLMSTFQAPQEEIHPLPAGHTLTMKPDHSLQIVPFAKAPLRSCSFERIYFSNVSDPAIYRERKALGKELAERVYQALEGDLQQALFTYVPNSSLSAFQGLVDALSEKDRVRVEHMIAKNKKMRTFISPEQKRKHLVGELYEIIPHLVTPEDTLVVVDDSIVRGTTLRDSLLPKLLALGPKKILVVSSAPPVLYPDCYGIDMSQIGQFVGFQAAVCLLKESGKGALLEEVYEQCKQGGLQNAVQKIYAPFTLNQLSSKISTLLAPDHPGRVEVIYQSLEGLRKIIPDHLGDWYFGGDYPTSGGREVVHRSFLQWMEGDLHSRSY